MKENNKPFFWANEASRIFLSRGYLQPGQDVQERVREIADHAEKVTQIEGFADKFYDYMSRGFYSLSSPVWSNYGTDRGLPVSCFNSHIDDNMESIMFTLAEIGMLSKFGGGTSGYIGDLRPRGSAIKDNGKSSGSVHFMELFDTLTNVVSQGSVRRGFFAPYLPIEHDDYDEFVGIGSDGHPIQHLIHGVTVTDEFLQEMIDGDTEKREKWAKLIQNRCEVGYPYIFFEGNVNRQRVDVYKDKNMRIKSSNMCTEITLPSTSDESFVCVLSSMNLLHYDEWKDTDAVETLTIFLDTVVTEFLTRIESKNSEIQYFLRRAYNFAKRHRALGLGVLGWHSYLQSKMIAYESREAAKLNLEIFKTINERAWKASEQMAEMWGEPEVLESYRRRNTTLTAIAPTKSSSFILGQVSQSIEPDFSNYYVRDVAKYKATIQNPYLTEVLEAHGKNNSEVWGSIRDADGSCQHLDFLTDHEKDVFKTIYEINPMATINQAAIRQDYVDQSQPINLMVDPEMKPKEINKLYIEAWNLGIKTLYYQYSLNAAQSYAREKYMDSDCAACEG